MNAFVGKEYTIKGIRDDGLHQLDGASAGWVWMREWLEPAGKPKPKVKFTYGNQARGRGYDEVQYFLKGEFVSHTSKRTFQVEAEGIRSLGLSSYKPKIGFCAEDKPIDEIRVPADYEFKDNVPSWLSGVKPSIKKKLKEGMKVIIRFPDDADSDDIYDPDMDETDGLVGIITHEYGDGDFDVEMEHDEDIEWSYRPHWVVPV